MIRFINLLLLVRCGGASAGGQRGAPESPVEENHRTSYLLIHQKPREERYLKLSDPSNLIVMTDEAHCSQYDVFKKNMREALPNSAFIGFTGTPLMGRREDQGGLRDYTARLGSPWRMCNCASLTKIAFPNFSFPTKPSTKT